jgi:hypothetical protein
MIEQQQQQQQQQQQGAQWNVSPDSSIIRHTAQEINNRKRFVSDVFVPNKLWNFAL